MSRNVKMISCGRKLADVLKKRGLGQEEVSKTIGYSDNYISSCIAYKRISVSAAKLLELEYRITPDMYADEPEKEKPTEIDMKILAAKLEGIVKALEQQYTELTAKMDRLIAEWEGTK